MSLTVRTTLTVAAAVVCLTGCSAPPTAPPPVRGTPTTAVTFTENLYRAVLTGDTTACDDFTPEGRHDFVADMYPASSCEEAVTVLGNALHDDADTILKTHQYTVEDTTATTVVVRADFGTYTDLMTVEWVNGRWFAGPTHRLPTPAPAP